MTPPARANDAPPFSPAGKEISAVPTDNEWTTAEAAMKKKVLPLLDAGDFAALDAIAKDLRTSKDEFAQGGRRLNLFYYTLGSLEEDATELDWQKRMTLIRRWFEGDPASITARVTMAFADVEYAWFARGAKWAHLVPPDAWNLVAERVTEANRILEAARDLPDKCPFWYSAWMIKAMLSQDTNERYDEIFAEAIHTYPTYTSFYLMKAFHLQPRWYGREGDWQAFAQQSADQVGGEAGDILYARIVWYVRELHNYSNPIADTGIDWPRAQRGFEAILRRYPDSLLALSEYCSLAQFAPTGAAPLMARLFQQIGNRADLKIWDSTDKFLQARNHAYSQQPKQK